MNSSACIRNGSIWLLLATAVLAQELQVDINNNNRAISEGLEPGYTSWNDVTAWFTSGANSISKTFSGVTVTFTRVGGVGTALKPGYNKPNIQSATLSVKLTADGITVDGGEAGAQIEMRIGGLSAGSHTIAVYHNAWDNLASLAPLNVFLNGTQAATNLPTSINVTENIAAGISYTTVNAVAGQDVVLLFAARTSGSEASKNVYINAFEIDAPNPKQQARNPNPGNADEHVDADNGTQTLSWSPAYDGSAVSHHIYYGTNSAAVQNATTNSSEFKGNQTTTSYAVAGINPHLTYYWRIDEVSSGGAVTKGTVWYFRPRRLAFPGAEGYGRFARGGRGGVVVKVTNLNDSGPGSLRDAILGNYGPRTVIFDVSGLITLQDDIIIGETLPYITVAGQTAPGKGICVKKWTLGLSGANDNIIRFIRSRPGRTLETIPVDKYSNGTTGAVIYATAAMSVDGMGMQGSSHSIIDHCSISWTIDEAFSSRAAKNITLQRTMISEALNKALHPNYIYLDNTNGVEHGYAASVGGDIGSFHHNLLAHCYGRNWSMAGGLDASATFAGRLDFNNNVVFNWGSRTTDGGAMEVDFVGNYYKPGPGTTLVPYALTMNHEDNFAGSQRCYFASNVMVGHFDESNQTVGRRSVVDSGVPTPTYETFVTNAFFPSYVSMQTALGAYKNVLSDSGCNLPILDDHDARIIRETLAGTNTYTGSKTGKKGFPDVETDVGSWEDYGTAARPADWDTDRDGMPNWWEAIKGFNPNSSAGDFSESNSDLDGDGYTALEDYLNWMAAPHVDCNAGSFVDINLAALTQGYTNNTPRYAVFNAFNGTVVTNGNGRTARFTPAVVTNALAGFTFSVTDASNFSMTNTIGLRVLAAANAAPVFSTAASNRTINVGVNLIVTNTATDADVGQVLTYSLLVRPTNATINASNGVLHWRPLVAQASSTNPFSVLVADNGSPSLTATQAFSVIVSPLASPTVGAPQIIGGSLNLNVDGQVGPDYAVQGSTNLVNWSTLLITNPAAMPFSWSTDAGSQPVQYYRIKVGPPLP